MRRQRSARSHSHGFTVVELMIATAVFATVLILVTTGIIQFSKVYYKGVTESNTQNTARNIIETVSQAIQFDGGVIQGTTTGPITIGSSYDFCIGNVEYSYRPFYQLVDSTPNASKHQTNHSFVVQTVATCSAPTGGQTLNGATASGRELLAPNMRLSKMVVTNVSGNLWQIQVRVVFGDDDLLNNPTAANASCKGSAGDQFCSVSDLSTIVIKRVQ